MITISLLDVDIGQSFSNLYLSLSSNSLQQETHLISCFPLCATLQGKELKVVIQDSYAVVGSVSFSYKLLSQSLNLVRWITLFDPKDDTYDGNLQDDDHEQPRVLIRLETNSQKHYNHQAKVTKQIYWNNYTNSKENNMDKNKIQAIIEDHKEMQQKYQALKEDLLQFRETSQQEIRQLESDRQQYILENKQLKQQLQQLKTNENNHSESIQEIQQKLSTLSDEIIQESQETGLSQKLVEKIKLCFQNINVVYDSLSQPANVKNNINNNKTR